MIGSGADCCWSPPCMSHYLPKSFSMSRADNIVRPWLQTRTYRDVGTPDRVVIICLLHVFASRVCWASCVWCVRHLIGQSVRLLYTWLREELLTWGYQMHSWLNVARMLHKNASDSNWPVPGHEGGWGTHGLPCRTLVVPCVVGQCNARFQNGPIFLHSYIEHKSRVSKKLNS